LRWVAGTLHLNAGNCTLDLCKIAGGQLNGSSADIFFQPM
jgi:hypothetical protein